MGRRGAGRRLNDQERMEILEIVQREAKVKNVDLAKQYGVSEGAIRKLRQMKDTVRNRYYMGNEQNRDKRKRGGFKRNAPFEQELYQWIVRMRESQPYQLVPLTQTAVRQQAIILSKNYEKMANFKASPGWFARFCSRHRLDPVVVEDAAPGAVANDAAALGVPQSVSVPPAVSLPMAATGAAAADETAFLMDSLTAAPVTTSQAMDMVGAAATGMEEDEGKTDAPSINEQAQLAAREHNEAALRAAAAKIGEAQAAAAAAEAKAASDAAQAAEAEAEAEAVKAEAPAAAEHEEQDKKHDDDATAAVAVAEDEIFSLGL
ncbi:Heat shock factor protein 2 [Phytophthora cinnamomi]|uniref:Heat shock factor protein 2 n=1 Tax=Phytophthora cinnamomi TaxID=4785 RepID=UPI00355A0BF9|nr:Heat shock factor protein 2 [Phytophthora cinnamomi]